MYLFATRAIWSGWSYRGYNNNNINNDSDSVTRLEHFFKKASISNIEDKETVEIKSHTCHMSADTNQLLGLV